MGNGRPLAGPRFIRWQEIQSDLEKTDNYILQRKFGANGTLAIMRLRQILQMTAEALEKGGF